MTRLPVLLRWILLLSAGVWLAGCKPLLDNDADDQRNPDFLKGISRKNGMDYRGAVEAFEAALTRNPRSAAAHLELGLLYEQQMNDHAAAIYHYQKHLALKPDSNVAEMLRGRIESCKLDMVKTVSLSTVSQQVQANLTRLTAENAALRLQVAQLQAQLNQRTDGRPGPLPLEPAEPGPSLPPNAPTAVSAEQSAPPRIDEPSRSIPRTHTVKLHDTFYSIGRLYGFRNGDEVEAANPGIPATKLRPGLIIAIPPRRD